MPDYPAFFRFETFPVSSLRAVSGANEGDPLGTGDDAVPGDVYRGPKAGLGAPLSIADDEGGQACVADGSAVGRPGAPIQIVACATLMGSDGQPRDVLLLDIAMSGPAPDRHVMPLADLQPDAEYELLACDRETAPEKFADIASVSFLAGTNLTLSDGRQVPVEQLRVGDKLLTRLHGPREIRWIGHQTRRATGAAAPVRITAGTLNTLRDLRLSPYHRLFVWQRRDTLGTGRAEVMVKAEALVNGSTVRREEGGHIDSYHILFDRHEIIFAEGIAVESMLVAGPARHLVPQEMDLQPLRQQEPLATSLEVDAGHLDDDAVERLRQASHGRDEPS